MSLQLNRNNVLMSVAVAVRSVFLSKCHTLVNEVFGGFDLLVCFAFSCEEVICFNEAECS